MRRITNSRELRQVLSPLRKKGRSIGFVPTMGYLHEGHLSLVRASRKENQVTVASIFVNPLQFGPQEDFWRYPRDLVRDTRLLKEARADFLFTPLVKELYPEDFQSSVVVRKLSRPLCGVTRPAHFGGVATVVLKLLNIVQPGAVYLGQKDYQQFRVVEQMAKDLDLDVKVRMAPIVREPDGLAMSSRNVLLSTAERREAVFLYRALEKGADLVRSGQRDAAKIKKAMRDVLKLAPHGRVDYAEIVDAAGLEAVVKLKLHSRVLLALAVFFGKTRLIDNNLVTV
ncbi:MAG: pantoate--beta-alanine ligase [Candidatus Omnitrophota bacterium]